jgi:hypothetical protein
MGEVHVQKSARNLTVQSLDKANRRATFYDSKLKLLITTELTACSCRDFNYVGKSPRSRFKPCMHIYRLAMETGLIDTRYEDYRLRAKVKAHGVAERRDLEGAVLRSLPPDLSPLVAQCLSLGVQSKMSPYEANRETCFLLNAIPNGMKKFDSCTVRSQLGFSRDDVCAHDGEVIASSLKRLLGVMLRDETPIVVQERDFSSV